MTVQEVLGDVLPRFGVVYRAFLPDGSSFIGKTLDYPTRKKAHYRDAFIRKSNSPFNIALRENTWDAFTWELIEENVPSFQLAEREAHYVEKYDAVSNGFNKPIQTLKFEKLKRIIQDDVRGKQRRVSRLKLRLERWKLNDEDRRKRARKRVYELTTEIRESNRELQILEEMQKLYKR